MDILALPTRYGVGKASVDAGGTVVTPTDASWFGTAWGDDLFFLPSQPLVPPQRIAAADPDGTLTLAFPWPGTDAVEEDYEIRFIGIIERSTAQSRRVLEQLGDVKAWYDIIVEDDAARLALESLTSPLRAGYRVLVKADGVIWAKETSAYGEWIGPVEFKGDQGSKGWSPQIVAEDDGARRVLKLAGYVGGEGVVPTENVGKYFKGDGTWTNTIGDAADFRGEGFTFMGAYNGATDYDKGNVARDNGSSWIALQPTTGNAPPIYPTTSNAFWALLAVKGQDGTGTGDVVGPTAATDGSLAAADGPTGKLIKFLSPAEVTAAINAVVGDSGSGGTKGLVPAPSAGDAAAKKFLRADGTWAPLSVEELEFTVSQLALGMADALNVAQFLGPNGNRFTDSFDALTYVDVAGGTNLNTSTAGVLKPTSSTTTQTIGTAATSADAAPGFTWFDRSVILTAGDIITRMGVYSGPAKTVALKIGLQVLTSAFDVVVYQVFSHPGGGWADVTLSAPFVVPGSGTYNAGAFVSGTVDLTAARARSFKAGDVTGTGNTGFTVDSAAVPPLRVIKNPVTSNLTVRSAAFAAASVPTKMKALINVKEVDAALAGTDYTLECSRDDGTTWTGMALTERYTLPTTGLGVVEAAETDVSGQPSGTAPRWRFKTLNSKNVELHDVYLYWS